MCKRASSSDAFNVSMKLAGAKLDFATDLFLRPKNANEWRSQVIGMKGPLYHHSEKKTMFLLILTGMLRMLRALLAILCSRRRWNRRRILSRETLSSPLRSTLNECLFCTVLPWRQYSLMTCDEITDSASPRFAF